MIRSKNKHYYLYACAVLIIAGSFLRISGSKNSVPLSQPLDTLPRQLSDYVGRNAFSSERTYEPGSADAWIYRTYVSSRGQLIHVFVGYWEDQDEEKRVKSPRYVGEGWGYYWMKAKQVKFGATSGAEFKEFLNEKGDRRELVYYCFFINRKPVSGEFGLRMLTMINVLFHQKSNAAMVRVSVPLTSELQLREAESVAENFISDFLPLLRGHLPL